MLAFLQFTIILDFMVLSPLGAQLLQKLNISTQQFGWVVSAYAFSAGAAGLMAAGFADRYDRKRMLLFFYTGFIIGTFLCGMAPNYHFLLFARIITGLFGGVIGSVIFAIITDLFSMEVRGRVMGFVQMAFAVSQVLGLPVGLYLANIWGWHAPFLLIVGVSIPAFAAIAQMNRRAKLQLHLQEAVEGLSVVVLTYYGSQLVQYLAKGTKDLHHLNTDLITAVSIPITAGLVAWGTCRMRKKLAAEDGGAH